MGIFQAVTHLIGIILHFFSEPGLPRKVTISMIAMFKDFYRRIIFTDLKSEVLEALKSLDPARNIAECFQRYENIFDYVDTEKKIFALLRLQGHFEHELISLGFCFKDKIVQNVPEWVPHEIFMAYVPLRKSLEYFLKLPGMFQKIMDYVRFLKNDTSGFIFNIMQGTLWTTKYSCVDKILLPLFFYIDEFQAGNPLGSHTEQTKLLAMYSMLACLPPEIASKLSSILFCGLMCAKDKKLIDNDRAFKEIIKEFNYLRTRGLSIKVNGVETRIYFQLVLVLGDNLGLNEVFGFVPSFKDTIFCRICRAIPEQWQNMSCEVKSVLRNKINYEADVAMKNSKITGIVERCTFNLVIGFDIMDNVSFDMMHDYLHGALNYILRSIIFDFVLKKKIFDLDSLNRRIQDFEYPKNQFINTPPEFQFDAVKNKVTLKCSAAEMLTLIRFLGLMIGPLIKNQDDESWQLYKYAREILDIIMCPFVDPDVVSILKSRIKELNRLYKKLFGPLRPKFHYLVHYPRYLLINGPLVNYWTMRFESRHRQLKSTIVSISCNINLLVSTAIKQTLAMCKMIHSFIWKAETEDQKKSEERIYLDKIEIDNSIYCKGVVVIVDNKKIEKIFGEIQEMYQENNEYHFVVKKYEQLIFDDHMHVYILSDTKQKVTIKFEELPKIPPCFSGSVNGNIYVIPHYKL